jgi:hypothetical protein
MQNLPLFTRTFFVLLLGLSNFAIAQQPTVVNTKVNTTFANTTEVHKTKTATDIEVLNEIEKDYGLGDVVRISVAPPPPPPTEQLPVSSKLGVNGGKQDMPLIPNATVITKTPSASTPTTTVNTEGGIPNKKLNSTTPNNSSLVEKQEPNTQDPKQPSQWDKTPLSKIGKPPVAETSLETPVAETNTGTPNSKTGLETPVAETNTGTPNSKTGLETPVVETNTGTPNSKTGLETPVVSKNNETPSAKKPAKYSPLADNNPGETLAKNPKTALKNPVANKLNPKGSLYATATPNARNFNSTYGKKSWFSFGKKSPKTMKVGGTKARYKEVGCYRF